MGAASLVWTGSAFAASSPPEITLRSGRIQGRRDDGISRFIGIPYGADTSKTRFLPPRPPEPWDRLLSVTDYGASCPQPGIGEAHQSEACLYLNVFTPEASDRRKRPVMVYIHGGAYMTGSGSDAMYDGSAMASHADVVVVTLNHRLNAFGYLYLARLEREVTGIAGPLAQSGNVGQLDIHLALQWIQDHIALFGGDPVCVMVFGQSGGGAKIATLMATPSAQGLVHRAATMSGQQVTASGPDHAHSRTKAYLGALGLKADAKGLASVSSAPMTDLVAALKVTDPIIGVGGVYMGPVVDQTILMRHPFYPDAAPLGLSIPMMIGNTHDETRYFLRNDPKNYTLSFDELPAALVPQMRVDIDPWLVVETYRKLYPDRSASEIYFNATTAARSWRGAIIEAEARAHAKAPAFVYQLDWKSPLNDGKWGACHTMDIPLVFGTTSAKNALCGDGEAARAMSRIMMDTFTAFARSGNPQTKDLPSWQPYDLNQRQTMVMDVKPHMVDDPRGAERRLFEQVPYIQQGT